MATDAPAEAGPALDAEVARLVFGVKRFYDWDGRLWKPEYEPYSPIHFIPSGKPWRTHRIDAIPVPPYSTDWGAAGLVVERMRQDGWSLNLVTPLLGANARFDKDGHPSAFATQEAYRRGMPTLGFTVPMAIVLAALDAHTDRAALAAR